MHKPVFQERSRLGRYSKRVLAIAFSIGLSLSMLILLIGTTFATHPEATLPGSNFEIDDNANLKLDDPTPSIDWGSLTEPPEIRQMDAPTGQGDDSYKGGTKEDTECPDETTGSIPNNKSDLLSFHVYEEPGSGGHPGFLNLAWSRVSDPSGTTLMDFEFNQSTTPCSQGPNFERTDGDLLIEYAIDQGGSRADISGRFWDATNMEWGDPIDLDNGTGCGGGPCATGTINTSVIPAGESDGLGEKQARTFGEAQIDLRLIFDDQSCVSFGSAMLKSRSSDSFTSQLKDFISPVPIDLQNCGNVIIRKETDPDGASAIFGYSKAINTDPSSSSTFTLTDGGSKDYMDTVLFGTGYTVTEDVIPSGWDFVSVDCSAGTVTPTSISDATVTFDIDSDSDVLDCTYTNRARASLTVTKITNDITGTFEFSSTTLSPAPFTLTTTATGAGGSDSQVFTDLTPGSYDVAEIVPMGWNLVSATCDNGDNPSSITLGGGDDVECTFTDEPERGAIVITKTRKHAADGPGDHPHAGVTFTVSGGSLMAGVDVVTDANGEACYDGLVLSSFLGNYTVTETVPSGYDADGATSKMVTVTAESTCGDGNEATVNFSNTPLTNISVSVDSQVPGGTNSTIDCVLDSAGPGDDISLSINDLQPQTVICTIVIDP